LKQHRRLCPVHGDDDWFLPGQLEKYLNFLAENRDVGYVLRSLLFGTSRRDLEAFHYLPHTTRFQARCRDLCLAFQAQRLHQRSHLSAVSQYPSSGHGRFRRHALYQVYLAAEGESYGGFRFTARFRWP